MSAPDFAAIMAAAMTSAATDGSTVRDPEWAAGFALMAPVLAVCTTCGGHGMVIVEYDRHHCDACPTIAHLLAIGAAVMSGTVVGQPFDLHRSSYQAGIDDCIAELRSVQP